MFAGTEKRVDGGEGVHRPPAQTHRTALSLTEEEKGQGEMRGGRY